MCSAIKSPFTFLQVKGKRFFANPIEPTQVAFRLVPKVFNAVNVIAVINESGGMIHSQMMKTRDIQGIVTGQSIGIDNTVGHNHLLDDRQQRRGLGIRNGCGMFNR